MEYKGYMVQMLPTYAMAEIKAKGQGKVPSPLGGLYTTKQLAMQSIDMYLDSLKKGKRNGKTKDASTG